MITIDLETTGLSPFNGDTIVLAGYKTTDGDVKTTSDTEYLLDEIYRHKVWIGHNIKFDMHFIRMLDEARYNKWLGLGGIVYDTQIVEYMLSGQSHIYPSLDELSEKYGGTQKDHRVTDMFNAGLGADEIPLELLEEYLRQDVLNTELIYRKQRTSLDDSQFWRLVTVHMRFLLFLQTCEYNGMAIDEERNNEIIEELSDKVEELEQDIEYICGFPINPDSNKHLAAWIYGGIVSYRIRKPDGVYKSGKKKGETKYRWHTIEKKCKGITKSKPKLTAKGNEIVNQKTLEQFKDDLVIKKVIELKLIKKQLSTYHINFRDMSINGILHCNLNQCSTVTGRISSSEPNLQNIPRGD